MPPLDEWTLILRWGVVGLAVTAAVLVLTIGL